MACYRDKKKREKEDRCSFIADTYTLPPWNRVNLKKVIVA
jgi:hypothetical protein